MHDAILVGINTLTNDDPRLQSTSSHILQFMVYNTDNPVNLLPTDQDLKPPQPIILDPTLRFRLSSRILKVWNDFTNTHPSDRGDNIVRQPWVICGNGVEEERIAEVEDAGAVVIPVELDADGKLHNSQITCYRS
jgi:2,5-diamino-6-(ribosylamino)-4(3H)-pyrimidinone 5'-phosphate reductase